MIIQYYSDSLGLSRPNVVALKERYIQLFINWIKASQPSEPLYLIDRSKGGATIETLYDFYKQDIEYIEEAKDVLIIHVGICDCAPRPISPRIRRYISKSPGFIRHRIISFLHNHRADLLKRGFSYYHTEISQFERILEKWLADAVSRFKRIYIFNIAPTNMEIEAHSPGFSSSIMNYNAVIRKTAERFQKNNVTMIDVYGAISNCSSEIDDYVLKADGHHITSKGHSLYFELLKQNELRFIEN